MVCSEGRGAKGRGQGHPADAAAPLTRFSHIIFLAVCEKEGLVPRVKFDEGRAFKIVKVLLVTQTVRETQI